MNIVDFVIMVWQWLTHVLEIAMNYAMDWTVVSFIFLCWFGYGDWVLNMPAYEYALLGLATGSGSYYIRRGDRHDITKSVRDGVLWPLYWLWGSAMGLIVLVLLGLDYLDKWKQQRPKNLGGA